MFTDSSAALPTGLALSPVMKVLAAAAVTVAPDDGVMHSRLIADRLALVEASVPVQRRVLRAGAAVYQAGHRFTHLYIINSGFYKVMTLSHDGREQIVSLKYRGDWLGFDGIAGERHECDAIAMDTGEVWAVSYASLLEAGVDRPKLLCAVFEAMSRDLARDRNSLMSVCTLPADARVADFLRNWARALARRGLRTDQLTIRMTRAEIGNHLGLTLETVSRGLSRLAKCGLVRFADKGRREIQIPDVGALDGFVQDCLSPDALTTLQ